MTTQTIRSADHTILVSSVVNKKVGIISLDSTVGGVVVNGMAITFIRSFLISELPRIVRCRNKIYEKLIL
jgi:hypothetical protein